MTETNKPLKVFRMGTCLKIAIWENQRERDGETVVRHSTSLSKRYRDKEGQWPDTDTLFPEDLLRIAMLTQKAAEWIELKQENPTEETNAG